VLQIGLCGAVEADLELYSCSPEIPALQLLQKSSKSASTTPQRPIWNTSGTVAVRDYRENGCMLSACSSNERDAEIQPWLYHQAPSVECSVRQGFILTNKNRQGSRIGWALRASGKGGRCASRTGMQCRQTEKRVAEWIPGKNIHAHDNGYGCATLIVQMTAASVTHGSNDPTTVEANPVAGEQWASAGRATGVGARVCLLPASRRRPA